MSHIGGVGINLAIQDAVATANLLARPLRSGRLATEHLAQLQRRRQGPTRLIQRLQIFMQNRVIRRVLGSRGRLRPPLTIRLLARWPLLSRIPARLIGMGLSRGSTTDEYSPSFTLPSFLDIIKVLRY